MIQIAFRKAQTLYNWGRKIIFSHLLHAKTRSNFAKIYAFYGIISTFACCTLFKIESFIDLLIVIAFVVACYCIVFIYTLLREKYTNRHKLFDISPENAVYYIYGDILDPNIIDAKTKSIVIPVNRCYDTAVDNDIISENSLHGQCFKKLYESQKYTPDTLYEAITKSLKEKHVCNITLENKRGHLNLYPEGSIAEVHFDEKTVLFLLALSAFRGDSTQTTKEEYFLSLSRLFERISERSQGMPVLIPLIGAGLSKTKLGDKILFQFIQDFILAHKDVIHCDIYIVLRSNLKYLIP